MSIKKTKNHIDKVIEVLQKMKEDEVVIYNYSINRDFKKEHDPYTGITQNIPYRTFSIKIEGYQNH